MWQRSVVFRRRHFGHVARMQRPVSISVLQASGDLLFALGHAFLQQRYGAILEAKLAQANGHFRLLVDGVRDHALFTVDPTGRVTSWSVGADRMFGHSEANIVGQNFSCMFTSEDIQNHVPEKQLIEAVRVGGWKMRDGASGQTTKSSGLTSTSQHCWRIQARVAALPLSCKT